MSRRWLIVGGSGMLGHSLCRSLIDAGIETWATANSNSTAQDKNVIPLDLAQSSDVREIVRQSDPDVIVYVAGLTDVDRCEANEALAERLHAGAALEFAGGALSHQKFVYISTDHLWDGTKENVSEEEPLHPLNAYARTKALGEKLVSEANPDALILRTNFFGTGLAWRKSLSDWMLERLRTGQTLNAFTDAFFTPIAMPLLSRTILAAVGLDLSGIYHCCGAERISKFEFAHRLAEHYGLDRGLISPAELSKAPLKAPRPLDMSLSTEKLSDALGHALPSLRDSLNSISSLSFRSS